MTNVGTKPLTVAAGTRGYQPSGRSGRPCRSTPRRFRRSSTTNGATWAYKEVTSTCRPGAQRSSNAWRSRPTRPRRHHPDDAPRPGRQFVANSRPQGGTATANYANVDVRNPAAERGRRCCTRSPAAPATRGTIEPATPSRNGQYRSASQPDDVHARGGREPTVSVRSALPAGSGDKDFAVTLASSDGHQTAVSAILRALIDT